MEDAHLADNLVQVCHRLYSNAKFMAEHEKSAEQDSDLSQQLFEVYLSQFFSIESIISLFEICLQFLMHHTDLLADLCKGKQPDPEEVELFQSFEDRIVTQIKKFIGFYLAGCNQRCKYEIIQRIMQKIVFGQQDISQSVIQDIMTISLDRAEANERMREIIKTQASLKKS